MPSQLMHAYTPRHAKDISRSMLERKSLHVPLELKSINDAGRFAGYASVFDLVDNQRDIIRHGAFQKAVQSGCEDIKLLWQHDAREPIGVFTTMFEDRHGLYVEGKLLLNVARAREAHSLLCENAIKGLSIGYSPIRYTIDPDSGCRVLTQVQLWEVSLVTFPANAAAQVTVVKGATPQCIASQAKHVPDNSVTASKQHTAAWTAWQRNGDAIRLLDALAHAERRLYNLF